MELVVKLDLRRRGAAGFHRAAGDEDGGDVQAHGGHEHSRGDLVAARNADHGVGDVRVAHVLDGVGDQLAARQRVEHAAVPHGDAVVNRDRVELQPDAAGLLDHLLDHLAVAVEMHVPRHELGERVHDGDDRLAEVGFLHAVGTPERPRPRHLPPLKRLCTAKFA
jgi:hypothetical protein